MSTPLPGAAASPAEQSAVKSPRDKAVERAEGGHRGTDGREGGWPLQNHNRKTVVGVREGGRARGRPWANHNRKTVVGVRVKAGVRAGGLWTNHNRKAVAGVRVKAGVRAGGIWANHNRTPRPA